MAWVKGVSANPGGIPRNGRPIETSLESLQTSIKLTESISCGETEVDNLIRAQVSPELQPKSEEHKES